MTASGRSAMLGDVIGLGVMVGFTDFPSTRMLEEFALRVRPRLGGLARSVVAS